VLGFCTSTRAGCGWASTRAGVGPLRTGASRQGAWEGGCANLENRFSDLVLAEFGLWFVWGGRGAGETTVVQPGNALCLSLGPRAATERPHTFSTITCGQAEERNAEKASWRHSHPRI
jgi:hypothetical protein